MGYRFYFRFGSLGGEIYKELKDQKMRSEEEGSC